VAEFYASLAATAKRLLTTYGQTVTITRSNVGTVDPITGAGTPAADTVFTAKGAVFGYNKALVDGVNVLTEDKRILIESTTEPKVNDLVATADGDYNVLAVSPLSPAGIVVVYELQARY